MATACRSVHTLLIIHFQSVLCVLGAFSLALFLWALARQAFSLTWLASVKMSTTLTGSFIRMSLDSKLRLFFFFFFFVLGHRLDPWAWGRFSTSASHPWHSQPDSLLSVSQHSLSWLPQKPSVAQSLSLGHSGWHGSTHVVLHREFCKVYTRS